MSAYLDVDDDVRALTASSNHPGPVLHLYRGDTLLAITLSWDRARSLCAALEPGVDVRVVACCWRDASRRIESEPGRPLVRRKAECAPRRSKPPLRETHMQAIVAYVQTHRGCKCDQIGDALGLRPATVRSLIFRDHGRKVRPIGGHRGYEVVP